MISSHIAKLDQKNFSINIKAYKIDRFAFAIFFIM